MFEIAWPHVLLALPLPWLVRFSLRPAADGAALRVPAALMAGRLHGAGCGRAGGGITGLPLI